VSKHVVDARNLLCPMPVIRTQDAVARSRPGDELRIVCTDPGAVYDVPAWCRVHGHTVRRIDRLDREICIEIVVAQVDAS
jgi:tRNA 2-thiouridine synthesizing protein A